MLDTMKSRRPQLVKIKQWSSKLSGASTPADSSQTDLTNEMEQRGLGTSNLYAATESYWSFLSKKKPLPFDAEESESKMLPIEALGLAMTNFGSSLPNCPYGTSLTSLGEAHIKLGSLQAAFAKDTSNVFLSRIARSKAAIQAFHEAVKKLDAATARMDAAQNKVQKSKKEKRELEEELRLAKAAYDQAVSDVECRAEDIQQAEKDDLECLATYMELHLDYIGQAQAVMEQVKASWPRKVQPPPISRPRSSSGSNKPPPLPRRTSAKEAVELSRSSSRLTTQSSISFTTSEKMEANGDSTAKREKKGRLRMPSFGGGKSIFTADPSSTLEKEKGDESSRWSTMIRKKEGFQNMDDDVAEVHNKVSSEDVDFGSSPFSPDPEQNGFDAIHERGESGLEVHDANYLGTAPISMNHTGASLYSDGGDPFVNGHLSGDDSYEHESQALTGGATKPASNGWSLRKSRGPPPPVPSRYNT